MKASLSYKHQADTLRFQRKKMVENSHYIFYFVFSLEEIRFLNLKLSRVFF